VKLSAKDQLQGKGGDGKAKTKNLCRKKRWEKTAIGVGVSKQAAAACELSANNSKAHGRGQPIKIRKRLSGGRETGQGHADCSPKKKKNVS